VKPAAEIIRDMFEEAGKVSERLAANLKFGR